MVLGQDTKDCADFLEGALGLVATITRYADFAIDSVEAEALAKPLCRIAARHPQIAERATEYADPAALVVAAAAIIGPRVAGYQIALREAKLAAQRAAQRPVSTPPPPPSPENVPPRPGATPVNFADTLLRQNGGI